jgi:electron-transferring-flavoprotein dehydrogenase
VSSKVWEVQLIEKISLDAHFDLQHYAIGIKELWDIDQANHRPGLVVHGSGWSLGDNTNGGFFISCRKLPGGGWINH